MRSISLYNSSAIRVVRLSILNAETSFLYLLATLRAVIKHEFSYNDIFSSNGLFSHKLLICSSRGIRLPIIVNDHYNVNTIFQAFTR